MLTLTERDLEFLASLSSCWRRRYFNEIARLLSEDDTRAAGRLLDAGQEKSRANPKADAAMAVLLLGVPTPNGYAARRTSFNATLSFAFRFLTR